MSLPPVRRAALAASLFAAAALLASCAKEPDIVLYCALDSVHSEALIDEFQQRSGLTVRAEFDVEAAKTVGLVKRIREEQGRPRCDVFWNNEIAHTVALADDGLLLAYDSPSAADIPAQFRDPQRRWTGFAARARVFIVNTELADPATIHGLDDLFDARWKDKVCVARPLTGTTLTHFTALYTVFGAPWTDAFLERLDGSGISLVQSNGQVMRLVREGQMAWGLTDSDDYNVARAAGYPVALVYPDQKDAAHPDARGTLLIPNTVAILKAAPHAENAKKLVDFLLSKEVEERLARCDSAQIPVRGEVPRPEYVKSAADLTLLAVDWNQVGSEVSARLEQFTERYLR